jgi:type I restriction enzyme S subunit
MLNQTIPLNEVTRPTQWKTLSTSELKSSGYPVYGANGIIGFYSEYTHKEPTLMITCRGATCGNLHISKSMSYINGNAMALDDLDTTKFDIQFLYYFLKVRGLNDVITGSAQPQITRQTLSKVNIPLVDLKTQKHIAEVLDRAEALKQKRQQAFALADECLRTTFLTLFGDPITNPKGWPVKEMKSLSTHILSGTTPLGGKANYVANGITFLRSQNVWKRDIRLDDVAYITPETHSNMAKSSLKNKDILMTKTGRFNTENSSLGRAAMYEGEDDKANINGHVYLIRLNSEVVNEFVLYILTTNEYRNHIRNVCVGGIDKRQLNKSHLEEFPIIYPPLELQEKFKTAYEKVEALKAKMQTSQTEIDHLSKSLSQKAFRGELTQN